MAWCTSVFVCLILCFMVRADRGTLKKVGRLQYDGRYLQIWEDLSQSGHYYVEPSAILEVNSTSCRYNLFTGVNEMTFRLVTWSPEMKSEVYRFIRAYINSTAEFELIGLLPMTRMRLTWKQETTSPDKYYQLVDDWKSRENSPSSDLFMIKCNSSENCTRLLTALKEQPTIFSGLELEYIQPHTPRQPPLLMTSSHLLSTPTGRRLSQLPAWPRHTDYRYVRSSDKQSMVEETVQLILNQLPGGRYEDRDYQSELEAQINGRVSTGQLSSAGLPVTAWSSVLWPDNYTRPDTLSCYLNSVLVPGAGEKAEVFFLDPQQRSAGSEGVVTLPSATFFTVPINSSTFGSSNIQYGISKQRFLDVLRDYKVEFDGLRFTTRPIKLYRVSLDSFRSKLLGSLSSRAAEGGIRSVPVKLSLGLKISADFSLQTKIVNLTQLVLNQTENQRVLTDKLNNLTQKHNEFTVNITKKHNEFAVNVTKKQNDITVNLNNLTREYHEFTVTSRRTVSRNQAAIKDLHKSTQSFMNLTGVVFTRWGRTVCPNGAETVYKGYVVRGHRGHEYGMGSFTCLTDQPTYFTDSNNVPRSGSTSEVLYRTAYGISTGLLNSNSGGQSHDGHYAVCVVCRRQKRTSSVVVWGSKECPSQWYTEYSGFLVSDDAGKLPSDGVCLDEAPEMMRKPSSTNVGNYMSHINVYCGLGLPCPPFLSGKPLSCATCTK